MHWYWLKWLRFCGTVANLAGVPGIVRECDYHSEAIGATVRVRKTPGYTIITVNGVDVYFHRLTGGIDGVGTSGLPEGLAGMPNDPRRHHGRLHSR